MTLHLRRLSAALVTAALMMAPAGSGAHQEAASFGRPYAASVALRWNSVALEAVRRTGLGPPIVARALAIAHTCMYDAWTAYDATAVDSRGRSDLRRPHREHTRANAQEAVSIAAYRALVDLFPPERPLLDDVLSELGYEEATASMDPATPAGVGNLACQAVLQARHGDGSNQLGDINGGAPYSDYTGYAPVNTPTQLLDPNRWQPLTFTNGQTPGFLAPHWGLVTPFALPRGDALRPDPPAQYPEARYTAQALALLRISARLTDREKTIAEYWADGPGSETPPGHWNLFARVIAQRHRHSLSQDIKLFFALNNALLDASIAAWDTKVQYDSVRPITAIRFLFAGQKVRAWGGPYQGTRVIDGKDWIPYQPGTFLTPPFAEYVSGHSTFSAAAAEVLKRFTGGDSFHHGVLIPPGSSRIEPGLTPRMWTMLYWPTFSAAADEASLSRRLGGIHFSTGDVEGRAMGRRVGCIAWSRASSLFEAAE